MPSFGDGTVPHMLMLGIGNIYDILIPTPAALVALTVSSVGVTYY